MPTAHDHYLDAERHLIYAKDAVANSDDERSHQLYAQVHATLALAAANGANRPPAEKPDVRMMSDPPQQGEEITDQMGGMPGGITPCSNPNCACHDVDDRAKDIDDDPPPDGSCPADDCVLGAGHSDQLHLDEDGQEFDG